MHEFAKTCEHAARAGGDVLLQWRDRFVARSKAPADLVTEADLASQEAIRQTLLGAYPDHGFLGEEDIGETGASVDRSGAASGYRWLVDPLDGTTNYVHKLEHYCVSVALEHSGELLVGTVFDPVRSECFTAISGGGTYLNGAKISTSRTDRLQDALVAASFAASVPRGSNEIRRFIEVLHRCQSMRRLGSAALNLCYIAAGRLDAYWASSVSVWDVAAGILAVREAGGVVTSLGGGTVDLATPRLAASATSGLHRELLDSLAAAESAEAP